MATPKTASEASSDDESLQSGLLSGLNDFIFDQRGRVDCMLLVSGKVSKSSGIAGTKIQVLDLRSLRSIPVHQITACFS